MNTINLRALEDIPNLTMSLSLADARTILGELFSEELRKAKARQDAGEREELLTQDEAAEMLGVTKVTLWNWTKAGNLKRIKIGRKVFFQKGTILALMGK